MNSENQDQTNSFGLLILLGAILGAITGAGAGYGVSQRIKEGEDLQLTAGDGIKLGGSIITLLRQVSSLGK